MSAPTPLPYTPPAMPHGRAGPRGNGARVHAIVAVSVISSVGTIGAFLAFFFGIFLADACHDPGDLACNNTIGWILALGSLPVVVVAVVLAGLGVERARRGGGHALPIAAWVVWGGFCLVWWVLFAAAAA